jgi:GNAT superfamily N-acetyltransferase
LTTTAAAITELPVRALTEADLPAIAALTSDRGWPPQHSKWQLMFAVSEPYGVDDPAGGLAGIVVLTRYRPALAVVGMMVVASRHGRRGLGRRLMAHVLALAGDTTVCLTATTQGRPLYERVGFRAVGTSVTYTGWLRADAADDLAGAPRRVTAADLAAIAAADLTVFGADRRGVLTELVTFADDFRALADPEDGYAACRGEDGVGIIGPVVARSDAAARTLISSLSRGATAPVRVDILDRHAGLAHWVVARGLAIRNQSTLMVRGGDLPGDRARLYCPASVAIG